ncbi:protein of unknown function [Lactiplantibacillus plantarum]
MYLLVVIAYKNQQASYFNACLLELASLYWICPLKNSYLKMR